MKVPDILIGVDSWGRGIGKSVAMRCDDFWLTEAVVAVAVYAFRLVESIYEVRLFRNNKALISPSRQSTGGIRALTLSVIMLITAVQKEVRPCRCPIDVGFFFAVLFGGSGLSFTKNDGQSLMFAASKAFDALLFPCGLLNP